MIVVKFNLKGFEDVNGKWVFLSRILLIEL